MAVTIKSASLASKRQRPGIPAANSNGVIFSRKR
jgi:hypothetical protein